MDIWALTISIGSAFFTGFFTLYFNKKLKTHESVNKVKETMSIEKYKKEEILYNNLQFHLKRLDEILNSKALFDKIEAEYVEFNYQYRNELELNPLDKAMEKITELYDFFMQNQANLTEEISNKIENLIDICKEHFLFDSNYQAKAKSNQEKIIGIRTEIYKLIRIRKESTDIISDR